ncbi:MAG: serine/threonine dehydratase [bacterium]
MKRPDINDVQEAYKRINSHIHNTPIISSSLLNQFLGHTILFKAECLQKVGAFKARGGLNTVKWLLETDQSPQHIVANSSGNHAQAVAWAAHHCQLPSTIFMPANVSVVKAQATQSYGANVVLCADRNAVDTQVAEAAKQPGHYWIPPYDHPQVIAGQGTAALEALTENSDVDAVFAPCGGGGLLSGTVISTRSLVPKAQLIGVEPLQANDAANSLRSGKIEPLDGLTTTLADGARTPSVGPLTFHFLQQLDDFYEVDEAQIIYWTQWLQHLLKLHVEPTSAMTMEGVVKWLARQKTNKTVLVILSGGNIDTDMMNALWKTNKLDILPSINNLEGIS